MITVIIITAVVVAILAFMRYAPTWGGKPSANKIEIYRTSPHYSQGKFENERPARPVSSRTTFSILRDFLKGNLETRPNQPLKVVPVRRHHLQHDQRDQAIWLGHSTFLLRLDRKLMLLDPMLGQTPSPLPPLGGRRFSERLPVEIDDIPAIDAVLVSHDHYDHLDYGTIRKLKDRVGRFYVPLGIGPHLERWGVPAEKITECDWWDEHDLSGLKISCTPARHFSGRRISNRNSTLWCSWVIAASDHRVFFSGDGGYGSHFQAIGDKYGPFDLTLLECGQYDPRWAAIHMTPEQTVQAHLDLQGRLLMPMHWGAFTLAMHSWSDPIVRVSKAAAAHGQTLTTPQIGETIILDSSEYPHSTWWK